MAKRMRLKTRLAYAKQELAFVVDPSANKGPVSVEVYEAADKLITNLDIMMSIQNSLAEELRGNAELIEDLRRLHEALSEVCRSG